MYVPYTQSGQRNGWVESGESEDQPRPTARMIKKGQYLSIGAVEFLPIKSRSSMHSVEINGKKPVIKEYQLPE